MSSSSPPSSSSESRISETWDSCIEQALLKTSAGIVLGGLAAVVLFRSPGARGLVSGLAGGFGAGLAWTECGNAFKAAGISALPPTQK